MDVMYNDLIKKYRRKKLVLLIFVYHFKRSLWIFPEDVLGMAAILSRATGNL